MKRAWLLALAVAAACNNTPPPPKVNKLVVTQSPFSTNAGEVLKPPLVVQVRTEDGQVATMATPPISVALGLHPVDAELDGTRSANAIAGVAVFGDLSIATAGAPYTLFVSSPGFDEDSSMQITISSPPPRHLVFAVEPANVTSGNAFVPPVEVIVVDENVVQVVSDQGTLVSLNLLNSDGGAFIFGNTALTAGGAAVFPSLFANQPGNGFQLRASSAEYGTVDSQTFNVSP